MRDKRVRRHIVILKGSLDAHSSPQNDLDAMNLGAHRTVKMKNHINIINDVIKGH